MRDFVAIQHSEEMVTSVIWWSGALISFKTTRPADLKYEAGEYARVAFPDRHLPTWRAYSFVSSPQSDMLEFFGVIVPRGNFSRQLQQLQQGDRILIEHESYGFMTPNRFVDGEDLWLLGTGTGIGPYISMLRHGDVMSQFRRIFLVRGVRQASDLTPYQDELSQMAVSAGVIQADSKLTLIACLSQGNEQATDSHDIVGKRITSALDDGTLEQSAGLTLDVSRSRVMLCGNPQMVEDMRQRLHQRGFKPCRRQTPGQFLTENYW
jgi:ferredoxin--NADP+ reductase